MEGIWLAIGFGLAKVEREERCWSEGRMWKRG